MEKTAIKPFILFLPLIRDLIRKKNSVELKKLLKEVHPIDIADGWQFLNDEEKLILFSNLDKNKSIYVFENLPYKEQKYIIDNISKNEISSIIKKMADDKRADMFEKLPDKTIKKLFSLMKEEEIQNIKRLTSYPKNTAGSLMTTDFLAVNPNINAKQALLKAQKYSLEKSKEIHNIYVLDDENKLIGSVSIKALLSAPPNIKIKDIMLPVNLIKVNHLSSVSDAVKIIKKYDLTSIPVVNEEDEIVGVITIDDVIDLIEKKATKDIYSIGKMLTEGGEIIEYGKVNFLELVKRRLGWLILLLILDFFTGTVLKAYEEAIASVVALSFFIPMLLDTGGNVGSQVSTTIIRGLATGDVKIDNLPNIIKKELSAALIIMFSLAAVAFLRAYLLQKSLTLALTVGFSMSLIALLAILTGIALPIIGMLVGFDPAVMASPLITSVVDVLGLIIYFKIAQTFIPALR
jgi:magnesium transporter